MLRNLPQSAQLLHSRDTIGAQIHCLWLQNTGWGVCRPKGAFILCQRLALQLVPASTTQPNQMQLKTTCAIVWLCHQRARVWKFALDSFFLFLLQGLAVAEGAENALPCQDCAYWPGSRDMSLPLPFCETHAPFTIPNVKCVISYSILERNPGS